LATLQKRSRERINRAPFTLDGKVTSASFAPIHAPTGVWLGNAGGLGGVGGAGSSFFPPPPQAARNIATKTGSNPFHEQTFTHVS
jgi:hypothetical protein